MNLNTKAVVPSCCYEKAINRFHLFFNFPDLYWFHARR